MDKLKDVKKIAVLRANAIGDLVVILPAVQSLKQTYPSAETILLSNGWQADFLIKGRTVIDRVIRLPKMKGINSMENDDPALIETFFSQMQDEAFDIAMAMQGRGLAANPFLKRLDARLTIGFVSEGTEKPDRYLEYFYYQNEILKYHELAKLAGATEFPLQPEIKVLPADRAEVEGLMQQLGEQDFIVLHPFANDLRRMWPLENFVPLADALSDQGFKVVFTGSKSDKSEVQHIISRMKNDAINSCGLYTLGGLSALLAQALLVIGADTGPIHLARALKTPTIGFYWAPNLINWGPLFCDIHRPLVSWQMQCSLCGQIPNDPYPYEPKNGCDHNISFVTDISVQKVLNTIESLLMDVKVYNSERKGKMQHHYG